MDLVEGLKWSDNQVISDIFLFLYYGHRFR